MVVYNFKKITVVPTGKDFVDIVLSKTQRKTPTVVHPGYAISRIRQFYMRKVKFTQQTYHDKLSLILEEFPILDDIHPFYADLMNVLYDRDHYKLALGQLNTARHLIDSVASDYCKLLKYGDSLYRCKQLKRSALGRMCTIMKKQGPSLAYLEQVRQHLARLPSIDPGTRTLILCGFPNVGKSSFLNKVSRADVDVQPYPFTTKSLFVGHTDYKYLRFQVIDTPGILDHPLEQRNTIEMQSVTALAHLRAAILYVVDISEQCGYTLEQQIHLFNSIKPLFSGKPLLIVCNKIDVMKWEELSDDKRQALEQLSSDGTAQLIQMSTLTELGVSKVKEIACERLLTQRVEQKLKQTKKVDDIVNRLHVAVPTPRDDKVRKPFIPESVVQAREKKKEMEMNNNNNNDDDMEDLNQEMDEVDSDDPDAGKPEFMKGMNSLEWKKKYQLSNAEWRFDSIPEIVDGHNIADFIDPEILERLEELEREEEQREAELANQPVDEDLDLDDETLATVDAIRQRRKVLIDKSRLRKTNSFGPIPATKQREGRTMDDFEAHLAEMGIDASRVAERVRSRSRSGSRIGRKRTRSASAGADDDGKKQRAHSRSVSKSAGFKNEEQRDKAVKLYDKAMRVRGKSALKGPADRTILNEKPKHLFTGKRGSGKNERR